MTATAENPLASLHRLVWTSVMAALIAVGAYVSIPVMGVPFTFQTCFVFLAGYILGPIHGTLAILLYVAAGTAGLPVFAGGKSGLGVILGPTGGYLAGFAACAALTGLIHRFENRGTKAVLAAGAVLGLMGMAAMYGLGVARLKFVIDSDWAKAWTVGALPFLPWATAKLALALAAYHGLRQRGLLPR